MSSENGAIYPVILTFLHRKLMVRVEGRHGVEMAGGEGRGKSEFGDGLFALGRGGEVEGGGDSTVNEGRRKSTVEGGRRRETAVKGEGWVWRGNKIRAKQTCFLILILILLFLGAG